jgi:hypothetical protein
MNGCSQSTRRAPGFFSSICRQADGRNQHSDEYNKTHRGVSVLELTYEELTH